MRQIKIDRAKHYSHETTSARLRQEQTEALIAQPIGSIAVSAECIRAAEDLLATIDEVLLESEA
jgi:DNA recombination-dependent growth factor C